jgi:hypothetical protein
MTGTDLLLRMRPTLDLYSIVVTVRGIEMLNTDAINIDSICGCRTP